MGRKVNKSTDRHMDKPQVLATFSNRKIHLKFVNEMERDLF